MTSSLPRQTDTIVNITSTQQLKPRGHKRVTLALVFSHVQKGNWRLCRRRLHSLTANATVSALVSSREADEGKLTGCKWYAS